MMARIRPMTRTLAALAAAFLAFGAAPAAQAQAYPNKAVKILVGFAPGGAMDIVARTVGQKMASGLGQPVVIDNKPGAASNIAIRQLIDSPPDGYTVMLVANGLTANPFLYTQQPFDPNTDVVPITLVARLPVVIAANASSELSTLRKMIDASKAKPGSVNYGSPGSGSTPHLAIELFARSAGIQLTHIPYKGGSPAIADVLGGQLPLVAVNAVEVLPHVKAGKLRVLAALSAERVATLPDAPTIAESGFPGFEASVWHAFIAPKGTPTAVVDRLRAEIHKALADPQVKERLAGLGAVVSPTTSQELGALVRAEHERYGKLIREAGIKAN
ncbi:MAG: tripartite tricarboxylate transporter substrate binding protein [Betaproteobacteria bacterium]|nr:tripartite tricarboxylate transporter substrate binding protein [Betaproteobacteria bacterium]